jgi:RNA polymerase sigma-54 factor
MLLQRQVQSTRTVPTAHLAQTMTLLGLSALELRQKIETELNTNPALELVDERRCPTCRRVIVGSHQCPMCSQPKGITPEQPIVFVSQRDDFYHYSGTSAEKSVDEPYAQAAENENLPQYVMRQIAPELEVNDRLLAAHILTSINEDGLLSVPLAEIARYNHVPLSRLEKILRLIQHADPIGVGSPNPQEALLVQLEVLKETRPVPELAAEAIRIGMDFLSRHRYQELGRRLGISTSKVKEIARFISDNLYPYPGRAHWGENGSITNSGNQVYYYPDIIISKVEDSEGTRLVVEVALPLAGTLRVNPLFKEALNQAPPEKAEKWSELIDQASLLVKCLQQRNHTVVRLMQILTVLQRSFILQGNAYLQPVTRSEISKRLEVHESTISRAVSSKTAQLPNGHIIPSPCFSTAACIFGPR